MKRGYFWLALLVIVAGSIFLLANKPDGGKQTVNNSEYLQPASDLRDVHGLAVDVSDANQLWIASHNGLYVLKNDKELFKAGSSNDDYMGFAQDPTQPNTFYTAGHNAAMTANKGFQRSDDGGRTWKLIGKGASGRMDDFHALAVSPADKNIVYGSAMGQLQRSTNGGVNWEIVDGAPQAIALAASLTDKNKLYAATQSGLQVSADQGNNWKSTSLTSAISAVVINPVNEQEMLAARLSDGLLKSVDGGATWQQVPGNTVQGIMYIGYDKNNPSTIYTIAQDLSISKSTDGGASWQKIR